MTYDYDHTPKTAVAKIDLFRAWRKIVDKHDQKTRDELYLLLQKLVPYVFSAGYELDVKSSYIYKYYSGSDGVRMEGMLVVTEQAQNTIYATDPRKVSDWIHDAIGIHVSARKIGELPGPDWRPNEKRGIWQIDLTAS